MSSDDSPEVGESSSPVSDSQSNRDEDAVQGGQILPEEPPKNNPDLPVAADTSLLKCDGCGDIVTCFYHKTYREMKETSCWVCEFGKLEAAEVDVVKLSDAEEAIAEARKQGIDEGLKEGWNVGSRIERQRILDKLEKKINEGNDKYGEKHDDDIKRTYYGGFCKALEDLRKEI